MPAVPGLETASLVQVQQLRGLHSRMFIETIIPILCFRLQPVRSSSDLVTDILYLLLVLGEHDHGSSGEQAGAVGGLPGLVQVQQLRGSSQCAPLIFSHPHPPIQPSCVPSRMTSQLQIFKTARAQQQSPVCLFASWDSILVKRGITECFITHDFLCS